MANEDEKKMENDFYTTRNDSPALSPKAHVSLIASLSSRVDVYISGS